MLDSLNRHAYSMYYAFSTTHSVACELEDQVWVFLNMMLPKLLG